VLCGLIYLGAAKLRYRSVSAEDYIIEDTLESVPQPRRFITPNGPAQVPDTTATKVTDSPADKSEPLPANFPRQRAFFTFESAPEENASSQRPRPEETEPKSEPAEESLPASPQRIAAEETAVDTGDPVADRIRKAFSEGSIRTLFEESARRTTPRAAEPDEDSPEHSAPPDRLAG